MRSCLADMHDRQLAQIMTGGFLSLCRKHTVVFDVIYVDIVRQTLFCGLVAQVTFTDVLRTMKTLCGSVNDADYVNYMQGYLHFGSSPPQASSANTIAPSPIPFEEFRKGMLRPEDQPVLEMHSIDLQVLTDIVLKGLLSHTGQTLDQATAALDVMVAELIAFRAYFINWETNMGGTMNNISQLAPVNVLFLKRMCELLDIKNRDVWTVNDEPTLQFRVQLRDGSAVVVSGCADIIVYEKSSTTRNVDSFTGAKVCRRLKSNTPAPTVSNYRDLSVCQCEAIQRVKRQQTSIHVTDDMFAGYFTISFWRQGQCYHLTCPRTTNAKALIVFNLLLLLPSSLETLPLDQVFLRNLSQNTVLDLFKQSLVENRGTGDLDDSMTAGLTPTADENNTNKPTLRRAGAGGIMGRRSVQFADTLAEFE